MKRAAQVIGGLLLLALGGGALYLAALGSVRVQPRRVDWSEYAAGPTEQVRVFWVGHSLMNHHDPLVDEAPNVLEEVGQLARASGLTYGSHDHTLFGASLSLLWRGRPHSYDRVESQLPEGRRELEEHARRYDALVLTEGIPILRSIRNEYTSWYLQRFYCAAIQGNPNIRVYLMESWLHLQGSDPSADYPEPDAYEFGPMVIDQRRFWDRVADEAATGRVPSPAFVEQLSAALGWEERRCEPGAPIFSIPVGSAAAALEARLASPEPGDELSLQDGGSLSFDRLFQNPYIDWPETWPLEGQEARRNDEAEVLAELTLRHPDEDYDDIHPSRIGTYFSALVAYATLYRRSPLGLPAPPPLTEAAARVMQDVAWAVVRADPRAGVTAP